MFLNRSTHSWRGKVGGLSVCFIPVSVWVLWFCQQNIFVTCDILMDCFFSTDCGRASWIHFCWRQRLPWNPLLKDFFYTKLLKTKRWEIFWPDSSLAICFCEDISSEGAVFVVLQPFCPCISLLLCMSPIRSSQLPEHLGPGQRTSSRSWLSRGTNPWWQCWQDAVATCKLCGRCGHLVTPR